MSGEGFGAEPGLQWQQVTCRECKRSYQCTPADDYYGFPPSAAPPGPQDGVCFGCLLILNGHDPERTPVTVIGPDGRAADPREGLG